MSLNANELRNLYVALRERGDCVSADDLAKATNLSLDRVETGLQALIQAGLARNSRACEEEERFRVTE